MPRRSVSIAVAAALALLASPAASRSAGSITIDTAEIGAEGVAVTGRAEMPAPQGPQDLGGSKDYGAVNLPIDKALGIDVDKAEIELLDDGLRMTLTLDELPEQLPPEEVEYFWNFMAGELAYGVRARRTHLVGDATTRDPAGTLERLAADAGSFQLSGPCGADPNAVFYCPLSTWLEGSFDPVGDTVSMVVPFEHTDQAGRVIGEGIEPGAAIRFDDYGWSTIGAHSGEPAPLPRRVVMIRGASTFYIGPQVHLGFAGVNRSPEAVVYTSRATLEPDGTFSGVVDGRIGVRNTLFARVCNGVTCTYDELTLPPGPDEGGDPGDAIVRKSDNVTRVGRIPYNGGTEVDSDGERYIYAGQWSERGVSPEQGGVRVIDLVGDQDTPPFSAVGILDCPGSDNYVRYLDPDVYNTPAGDRRFLVVGFHENVCTAELLEDDPHTSGFITGFNGVMTVDVTDPQAPVMVDTIGHDSAHTVKPHPTKPYLFVLPGGIANGTATGGEEVRVSPTGIVDASDPTDLRYVRAFQHNAMGCHDLGFSADGLWAFCAGHGGVQVWDVSEPEAPVVSGDIVNPAIQFAHNAVVSPDGRYLVINDEAYGVHTCNHDDADVFGSLWIYDISVPRAPVLAGRISPPGSPVSDVQVSDWSDLWCTAHNYNFVPNTSILVASWFTGGTTVHDISDPLSPVELAYYQPSNGVAWSAHYYAGYVVTNDMWRGTEILDIPELRAAEDGGGPVGAGARVDRSARLIPRDLAPHPLGSRWSEPGTAFACVPGWSQGFGRMRG